MRTQPRLGEKPLKGLTHFRSSTEQKPNEPLIVQNLRLYAIGIADDVHIEFPGRKYTYLSESGPLQEEIDTLHG